MIPGMKPPARLKTMRMTICSADQITRASARRDGRAFSDRNGTWLTQMKALPTPPTNDMANNAAGVVARQRPSCAMARSSPEPIMKGLRPKRSLSMPMGMAMMPQASGAILATWPMKSSW